MRRALILNHRLEDEYWQAACLQELGRLLTTLDHPFGGVALHRGRHISTAQRYIQSQCVISSHLAERSIWFGDFAKAGVFADEAWELASNQRYERDFIRAALMQGRVALGLGNLTRADDRLHHALTRARAVNLVDLELPALTAIAELEIRQGRPAVARSRLDDVWEAAERGPYPLQQADAYNVLVA
jgi:ATP/maltotriose-dependent transcriptional regulator MalT